MRKLELLSPAKNVEVAIAAINNGADAVYIGGPAFGARQAVGNTAGGGVRSPLLLQGVRDFEHDTL